MSPATMSFALSLFLASCLGTDAAWSYLKPLQAYMPPRSQWDANYGYCGETSFIQAGLMYGQYLSQYTVRQMISGHQSRQSDQLLIGLNDGKAAKLLKLNYVAFTPNKDVETWVKWIKPYLAAGQPVTIGVLTNFDEKFFGTAEAELAPGQPDYDHIVNIVDIQGNSMDTYNITFYDHGLWKLLRPAGAWGVDKSRDSVFTYRLKDIVKSRDAANAASTAYSIINSDDLKYAIALTGPTNIDSTKGCPVFVTTNPTEERPVMKEGSNTKPTASSMSLTVTAYSLKASTSYVIYMYDDLSQVPTPSDDPEEYAVESWNVVTGPSKNNVTIQVSIKSDAVAVFRCYVSATAATVASTTSAVRTTTALRTTLRATTMATRTTARAPTTAARTTARAATTAARTTARATTTAARTTARATTPAARTTARATTPAARTTARATTPAAQTTARTISSLRATTTAPKTTVASPLAAAPKTSTTMKKI
jgi:hypothetical protein